MLDKKVEAIYIRGSTIMTPALSDRLSSDRMGSMEGGRGWEDWANISSEILVMVIKKVQDRAAEDNDEMRRVVAMAGVCRSWRLAIQAHLVLHPFSSTGLLQFPSDLREAGPIDKPVQCVMRRRGGQYFLYQSDCGSDQEIRESKCNFLMGACQRWRPGNIMFVLSAERNNRSFSHKSAGFMGELRSNLWGTAFVVWDFQTSGANNMSNNNNKTRPVTFVRFTEEMVNGVRKRKMTCVLKAPRLSRGSPLSCSPSIISHHHHGMDTCFSPVLTAESLWKWSCISNLNKSIRSVAHSSRPKGYLSLREEILKTKMEERVVDSPPTTVMDHENLQSSTQKVKLRGVPGLLKKGQKMAMFTGTIPEWDVRRQCWSLDFKGRATLPSMHNFQLLMPAAVAADDEKKNPRGALGSSDDHHQLQQQTVVMQLGKIGKGLYALEFQSPLSAFQAFNIALSSFATTVGVEH